MTKITTIPDDIRAQFPGIVERAIADGLRCEPADRPRAEAALREIYRLAGLRSDIPIIWVPSPLVGALAASLAAVGGGETAIDSVVGSAVHSAVDSAVLCAVHSAVHSAVDSAVDSVLGSAVETAVHSAVGYAVNSAVGYAVETAVDLAVYSAVCSAVRSAVETAVETAVYSAVYSAVSRRIRWHPYRGGQYWVAWPTFISVIEMLGADHPSFAAPRAEAEVCKSAGWYWPNRNFIMVCERPRSISRDAAGRLHSETGPSVDYGDTFKVYSWHGTTIPAAWITDRKSLTPAIALSHENIEQRRAACEMLG